MFYFGLVFAAEIHPGLLHPVLPCTAGIPGAKYCLVALNAFFMAIKMFSPRLSEHQGRGKCCVALIPWLSKIFVCGWLVLKIKELDEL